MSTGILEAVSKLTKDVKQGAITLGKDEARFLVDTYYSMQDFRITSDNQIRSITKSDSEEPHETLKFFSAQFATLENSIQKALDYYTKADPVGRWMQSQLGIGPVIAAGFLANLDIEGINSASHFWSYCGLNDRNRIWLGTEKSKAIINEVLGDKKSKNITIEDVYEICRKTQWKPETILNSKDGKGTKIFVDKNGNYKFTKEALIKACAKRPYNAKMKTLCWKMTQCFIKTCNNENSFYGKLYVERKMYEQTKNEKLDYKDQAEEGLKRVGKSTESYKWYEKGMLPPGQINTRAQRWVAKIFLSHLFAVMYFVKHGTRPEKPYAIVHLNHVHEIDIPNKDVVGMV